MTSSQSNESGSGDAKRYIDAILEINRKYGFSVELTPTEYNEVVREAAEPARLLAEERRASGASGASGN